LHSAFAPWCADAGALASHVELRYLGASFAAPPAASFCRQGRGRASPGRRSRKGASPHARDHHRAKPAASVSRRMARVAPLGAALLALLPAACGSSGAAGPEGPPCPTALLLKGAERTAGYRPGPGTRPADLRHLAVMTDLTSACRYDETGVDVGVAFDMIAEKGPAYPGGPLQLTYFVATVAPDQELWGKELFSSEIVFPEEQNLAGNSEQMTVRLPDVGPETGPAYRVYLGFQLDEAEMRRRLEPGVR